jgi:hypothetical protein
MKTHLNTPKSLYRSLPFTVFLSICCSSALSLFDLQLDAQPYLASSVSLAGPTGLTVVRNGEYNNVVSWHAVPGATSYHLQHRSLYPANLWTDVPGCDPTSTTCTDIKQQRAGMLIACKRPMRDVRRQRFERSIILWLGNRGDDNDLCQFAGRDSQS